MEQEPTRRSGVQYICKAKAGEVLTAQCAEALQRQIHNNGGTISDDHARHIIEEHQP